MDNEKPNQKLKLSKPEEEAYKQYIYRINSGFDFKNPERVISFSINKLDEKNTNKK